jgi:hypothetical protein
LLEAFGDATGINSRHVADIPALQALSTTQFKAATIGLSGSSRLFNSANLSAAITAGDPRFVASNADLTGASGAWTLANPVIANAADIGVVTGTVSDAVALTNAQRINAWLAGADCRVFDWRSDQIGIGQTIRLGRNGNGVIGVASHTVFEATGSTAGARARWQGASGGTMFLASVASGTFMVECPVIFGIYADGNGLARSGFVFAGVWKPQGDMLHVCNLENVTTAWAYTFRDNPLGPANPANCCYGGRFGQLTANVAGGVANGCLFTGSFGVNGRATTMCQFSYIHITCTDGYTMFAEKGDTNTFMQITCSRAAGGVTPGGEVGMFSDVFVNRGWYGNVIHNMNLSKTDGPDIRLTFSGPDVRGNSITYNCVDFAVAENFVNGAVRSANKITRLGQPNYVGGWELEPRQNLLPLPNVDDPNPNILDWYQEGTFTPGMTIGGSATGITFTTREGSYTRIGNVCNAHIVIILSSKGAGSGAVRITGLPFPQALGDSISHAISVGFYANFVAGIATPPHGFVTSSSIDLYKSAAGTSAALQASDMNNNSRIQFTVTWRVA